MTTRHRGGCHCGAVQFTVQAPADLVVEACNCSICAMTGYLHLIVARGAFELTSGDEALLEYRFGTRTARHLFCRHCGVKSFYVPRSHPDGVSVNARCLHPEHIASLTERPFDGQNWEQGIDALRSISGEEPTPP